jgi:hypothetical protein
MSIPIDTQLSTQTQKGKKVNKVNKVMQTMKQPTPELYRKREFSVQTEKKKHPILTYSSQSASHDNS